MVRKANEADAERIAEIYLSSYRLAFHSFLPAEYLFSKLKFSKRLESYSRIIQEDSSDLFVFEDSGLVFGFTHCGKSENADIENAYQIWDLFVEPAQMRTGIGTMLVDRIIKHAIAQAYSEVVLWTFEANRGAISFYEKHGFTGDGKEEYIEHLKAKMLRFRRRLQIE